MTNKKTTPQSTNANDCLVALKQLGKKDFGSAYEAVIVEQWKTCVETANGITEKRNSANALFITVNLALLTVITFSLDYKSMLLSVGGITICVLWIMLLDNYKRLNEVKYGIITDIEELLPLAPLKAEWERLREKGEYTGLTKVERRVPVIFLALYVVAILWPVINSISQLLQESAK